MKIVHQFFNTDKVLLEKRLVAFTVIWGRSALLSKKKAYIQAIAT